MTEHRFGCRIRRAFIEPEDMPVYEVFSHDQRAAASTAVQRYEEDEDHYTVGEGYGTVEVDVWDLPDGVSAKDGFRLPASRFTVEGERIPTYYTTDGRQLTDDPADLL